MNRRFWKGLRGRGKELFVMCALAMLLFYTAWKIFQTEEDSIESVYASMSENEKKVMRILQEIDGVGEASVVVCETEDGVTGVVVVCAGAKNLRVIMDVREAVAAALDAEEKAVKVYLKKE